MRKPGRAHYRFYREIAAPSLQIVHDTRTPPSVCKWCAGRWITAWNWPVRPGWRWIPSFVHGQCRNWCHGIAGNTRRTARFGDHIPGIDDIARMAEAASEMARDHAGDVERLRQVAGQLRAGLARFTL